MKYYSQGGLTLFFQFRKTSVFLGPLILLFWTFGDVCPGFRKDTVRFVWIEDAILNSIHLGEEEEKM